MKNTVNTIVFIIFYFFTFELFSKELIIDGNKFSDESVIISIIGDIPDLDSKSKSDYILKELNNSGLFQSVQVSYDENKFFINLIEFPSINKIFYTNNKRLKDEEIDTIAEQLEINTLSDKKINILIDELKKIYQSFGYNNINISTSVENFENNSANLFLNFDEGKITKISKINFIGNNSLSKNVLLSKIKSKTKTITNLLANNNFKLFQINNDLIRIKNYYKSQGYKDIVVNFNAEYFENNKVEVNFIINEGIRYFFSDLKINNNLESDENLNTIFDDFINNNKSSFIETPYDPDKLDELEFEISEILEKDGEQFYEIKTYEKINNNKADVLFDISKTKINYINQINIYGNTRTYDFVIRREIDFAEGDPVNSSRIKEINKKLNQLPIFGKVDVTNKPVNEDYQNIDIDVEEVQTGSFNIGFSIGTLDGASFLSGLKERNINGTGRSLEFLINTSEDNKAFTLSTTEKFFLNSDVNHKYSTIYNENNYSKSKSYKLNTLTFDTSFKYLFSKDVYHTFGIGYAIKDYIITDTSSVSSNILKSSGENVSFNLSNEITLNSLNSFLKPTKGNYISFLNIIESPSSSTNGFIKNTITLKKFLEKNKNIYSVQARAGNLTSLSNNEILSDEKYSLGGRWLRGFDNFGAGPRNSRTAYVGGNNLLVSKLDYSRPITLNDQNPIYFNVFNDYGLVWGNKNTVTLTDQSLRASYGFGLNYYSPIGPIGFTWGFPLLDKSYDIKRMFMFTIGNLN